MSLCGHIQSRPDAGGAVSDGLALYPVRGCDSLRQPACGSSFFRVVTVTAPALDTSTLSRCYRDHIPFAGLSLAHSVGRHSRLPTVDGQTTAPAFLDPCLTLRRSPCGAGSDTSFSAAVSRGHGRLPTSPAPWRHGAPLLSRHAGPSGFLVPHKKVWPSVAQAAERIFFFLGSPRKSGAWPGEQAPPALRCPARKRGRKGEKRQCIKTAFPSSASSATTHN